MWQVNTNQELPFNFEDVDDLAASERHIRSYRIPENICRRPRLGQCPSQKHTLLPAAWTVSGPCGEKFRFAASHALLSLANTGPEMWRWELTGAKDDLQTPRVRGTEPGLSLARDRDR